MPLRCPPRALFFLPTHLDCIVYSVHNNLNFRAKIDGNGPILMKLRLGEVWCRFDEFRCQHSTSRSFINIGLLSTYCAYYYRLWYHVSSYESRGWYDTGVVFNSIKQYGGVCSAALSWLVAGTVVLAYLIFVQAGRCACWPPNESLSLYREGSIRALR